MTPGKCPSSWSTRAMSTFFGGSPCSSTATKGKKKQSRISATFTGCGYPAAHRPTRPAPRPPSLSLGKEGASLGWLGRCLTRREVAAAPGLPAAPDGDPEPGQAAEVGGGEAVLRGHHPEHRPLGRAVDQ